MDVTLIKKDGKVSMEKDFDFLCSLLRNGVYTVRITRKTEPRTVPQNALMWMWFKCMEDATGQPKEDFHDYYKRKFLTREIMMRGRPIAVVGGTKELNTIQMTDFLNKVQADAAVEWGITLPLPADRTYAAFINEYRRR